MGAQVYLVEATGRERSHRLLPARCEQGQFSFALSSAGPYNDSLRLPRLRSAARHVQPIEAH